MQKSDNEDQSVIKTKLDLLSKIGTQGLYQKRLFFTFAGVWSMTSILLMSIVLFFIPPELNCVSKGLIVNNCEQAVCHLSKTKWHDFIDANQNFNRNIATDLGRQNLCSDLFYNELAASATYLGNFVGLLVISSLSDTYGRYKVLLGSWISASIGSILLIFSPNLFSAGLSLFFISTGANSCLCISYSYLAQVFEDKDRLKYNVIFQSTYAVVSLIITTEFILIQNWVLITIISLVIPVMVILIMIIFYVKQTPDFLLKQGVSKALKQFNEIGKINLGRDNILQEKDILRVLQNQQKDPTDSKLEEKDKKKILYTVIDLFRFPSLRIFTIPLFIIFFTLFSMYFGVTFLIDEFGVNIYISSYVLFLSQILIYYPMYLYIDKIPRKKTSFTLFATIGFCSVIIVFMGKNTCLFCVRTFFKIIVIVFFKMCISIELTLMAVYMNELYPNSIRATGVGFVASMGALSTVFWPTTVGYFKRHSIDSNILYVLLAYLSFFMVIFLKQTLGVPLKNQIEEVEFHRNQEISKQSLNYANNFVWNEQSNVKQA